MLILIDSIRRSVPGLQKLIICIFFKKETHHKPEVGSGKLKPGAVWFSYSTHASPGSINDWTFALHLKRIRYQEESDIELNKKL